MARYAEMGIKTILNLRGSLGHRLLRAGARGVRAHGITMIDARMHSREPPSVEQIRKAKALFETIEYPALMHCKSGADRAA
jgi:protein tyrosine/serine phosphatase